MIGRRGVKKHRPPSGGSLPLLWLRDRLFQRRQDAFDNDLALIDNRDAVGKRVGSVNVVGGEKADDFPALAGEIDTVHGYDYGFTRPVGVRPMASMIGAPAVRTILAFMNLERE